MTRISVSLMVSFLLICCALPTQAHADTNCAYTFTSGSGNTTCSIA
jgi:hypothetical protein